MLCVSCATAAASTQSSVDLGEAPVPQELPADGLGDGQTVDLGEAPVPAVDLGEAPVPGEFDPLEIDAANFPGQGVDDAPPEYFAYPDD